MFRHYPSRKFSLNRSRMLMRSILSDEARVRLLLLDEPSAALDPEAEQGIYGPVIRSFVRVDAHLFGCLSDLFARFRKLRGEKTMIFPPHRFGQLTKPADLILCVNLFLMILGLGLNTVVLLDRYMRDSTIVESGTHEELMAREGKYAELWKLQAEAFL